MQDITDTQRLKVQQLTDKVEQLYQLIVTGKPETGQLGLLEMFRNMAKDIAEIRADRVRIDTLERRLEAIEERHTLLDEQKKRIAEQKKRWNSYEILIIGTLLSNVAAIIMWLLGFK